MGTTLELAQVVEEWGDFRRRIFVDAVQTRLGELFTEHNVKVELVPQEEVLRLRQQNADFAKWSVTKIGRELKARQVLARLGVPEPKDWDDLLNPKLKGNVAQCAPTRSSSSHATYEVILQREGDDKGWDWLKKLAANTGMFTARSRDVPS